MFNKRTIGEWDEKKLALYIGSSPQVVKRIEQIVHSSVGSAGGPIADPTVKQINDVPVWDGFNWIAQHIFDAQISGAAAIAVSKLAGGTDTYILQTVGSTPTWVAPSTITGDFATEDFAYFMGE